MSIELLNIPAPPPVSPSECALLVAIPLDEPGFRRDLQAGDAASFARLYRDAVGGDDDDAWRAYRRYAELARHVIEAVQRLGVTVRERISLADFHAALPRFPVITLVAQWRDARFLAQDILDPERAAQCLGPSRRSGGSEDRAEIAAGLNELLDAAEPAPQSLRARSRSEMTEQQRRWVRIRRELELRNLGVFRGGAGVEFNSGFRVMEEIAAGISPYFAGLLDLTVCQSALLGEEVKRRCPDSTVMMNADLTSFDLRFAIYHQMVSLIAARPQSWEDAAVSIRKSPY